MPDTNLQIATFALQLWVGASFIRAFVRFVNGARTWKRLFHDGRMERIGSNLFFSGYFLFVACFVETELGVARAICVALTLWPLPHVYRDCRKLYQRAKRRRLKNEQPATRASDR